MGIDRIIDEEAIFNAALAIQGADERSAYLQKVCGSDSALLDRLRALLTAHTSAQTFLEHAASSLQLTLDAPALLEGPGTTIDRYKLLEKIGEGGMAVVYMAEQQHPIRRRVALKIIKLGMDTKQVIARFEAERQALALMDHPNIAQVFDGSWSAASPSPTTATRTGSAHRSGSSCSSRSATPCGTPTKRELSIGTSSRPT
jgi:hypothetical protein